jgi:hypothetical protein
MIQHTLVYYPTSRTRLVLPGVWSPILVGEPLPGVLLRDPLQPRDLLVDLRALIVRVDGTLQYAIYHPRLVGVDSSKKIGKWLFQHQEWPEDTDILRFTDTTFEEICRLVGAVLEATDAPQ